MTPREELEMLRKEQAGTDRAELEGLRVEQADRTDFIPEAFTRNPEQPAGINPIAGTAEQLLQGGSASFSDELQGEIAALYAKGRDKIMGFLSDEDELFSDKTVSSMAIDVRNQIRDKRKQFIEQEGLKAYVPEIIGGGLTLGGPVMQAKTLPAAIGIGVAEGAVAGAGGADADEFFSKETALQSGIGGLIGGATAGTIPVLFAIGAQGFKMLQQNVKNLFESPSAVKDKIVKQVEAGEGVDSDLGKYIINGTKAIKDNGQFEAAVAQGFDGGALATLRGASPSDRQSALRMILIAENSMKKGSYRALKNPGDEAGATFLKRVKHIMAVNKEAGRAIDKAAQKLRGKPLTANETLKDFSLFLEDSGVILSRGKDGQLITNFTESSLGPGDRAPLKEVLRQMHRMNKQGKTDAYAAHELKRIIDDQLTYGKIKTGMGGRVDNALSDLRQGLDKSLDDTYPDYNAANTTYAETITALNNLQTAIGKRQDLSGANADKALGQKLGKILGMNERRAELIDAAAEITSVSNKNGGKFEDDIIVQLMFADEVERVFGSTSDRGFEKGITRGIQQAVGGIENRTLAGTAAELAERANNLVAGKSDEAAFKAIKEFLKSN